MSKKIAIIGAGPGGYVAAIRAAQNNHKVVLIDKGEIGGVCLNVGCIPSKALITAARDFNQRRQENDYGVSSDKTFLNFEKTQNWKDNDVIKQLTNGIAALLKKNKVEFIQGEASFVDAHTLNVKTKKDEKRVSFDYAIIATGSRPIELNNFKFDNDSILDSTGLLNIKEIPKRLTVVGGGYIGSELANAFANFGSEVSIVEGQSRILSNFDLDISKMVQNEFISHGMKIETDSMVDSYHKTESGVVLTYTKGGKKQTLETDKVLISVGRRPNTDNLNLEKIGVELEKNNLVKVDSQLRTTQRHIYAIGDIVKGAALAHKASFEAKYVVESINGTSRSMGALIIPSICFTDLEVAEVGVTSTEANKDKKKYDVTTFPWGGNGRAIANADTRGFTRIISLKENNQVVGAQIVGYNAGELITQLTLAVENQLVLEDIVLTIHPHPSQSEAIMDAAELALGYPIHA